MLPAEIERRFRYHAPTESTRDVHNAVRDATLEYAKKLNEILSGDESREVSLMFTALEESAFWAHAHLARNRQ